MSNNKIYSTSEYNLFHKLKGNRGINELHVRKLVEAIKEKDLQIPIIVDHDMNVLDGQHRLDAYKIVGNPVSYICLLYTSPSPRDSFRSRMPSSA